MISRQENWSQLRDQPEISILIVGGGINGAGLFRELALQAVDVLLVEKSDFCAGTSAASGRVIHGGLRYLENGEFRLVRESLLERNRLVRNAPHYVKPLPTTIPVFGWLDGLLYAARQFLGLRSKPGNRGALIIKMGLLMYDLYAGRDRVLPGHRFEWRRAALARRPALNPDITCTATYYDARLNYAERLCLELILDAEAACSLARALNYVSVVGADGDSVTLRDEVSGERLVVKPRIVVNASGAWIDFTNRAMQRETQFIGGTKGSHLVVDHAELHALTQGQMIHFVNDDGRLTIFYPMGDKVLIGTTDIPVDDPETAICDEDETTYLLGAVNRVFPHIRLDRSHIVFRFCGVRPLPRSETLMTGQISRDHAFPLTPPGEGITFPIYSLVGGKWTTFRAFSQQVADHLLPQLGRKRLTGTETLPIGGGRNYPQTDAERRLWVERVGNSSGLTPERIEVLLERYGSRAEEMATYLTAEPDRTLRHLAGYSAREIQYLALNEKLVHLDDVILRRTMIGMLGLLTRDLLDELAVIVGDALGWTPQQKRAEIARTIQIFRERHGVTTLER